MGTFILSYDPYLHVLYEPLWKCPGMVHPPLHPAGSRGRSIEKFRSTERRVPPFLGALETRHGVGLLFSNFTGSISKLIGWSWKCLFPCNRRGIYALEMKMLHLQSSGICWFSKHSPAETHTWPEMQQVIAGAFISLTPLFSVHINISVAPWVQECQRACSEATSCSYCPGLGTPKTSVNLSLLKEMKIFMLNSRKRHDIFDMNFKNHHKSNCRHKAAVN